MFVDEVATSGDDLTANAGNPIWGWSLNGRSNWDVGDTVTFTGLALPIWANDPDSDGNTDNTQNATWRIRFYSAGADGDWTGTNNLASSDDSLIGTVDVDFNSAGEMTDKYYAVFDEAIEWTSDSSTIWFYIQALSNKAFRLKTGPAGTSSALRENRLNGNTIAGSTLAMSLAGTVEFRIPRGEDLIWTPAASGNNVSVFQETNWTDGGTGDEAAADAVNPDTVLDHSLRIRVGNPGGGGGAGGNLLLGTGELEVRNATLRMNASNEAGIDLGSVHRSFQIVDAKVLTQFVSNGQIEMDGRSELTLYGNAPLTSTTINLKSSDSFVLFLDRLPSLVVSEDLQNFTVNSARAVNNSNVEVEQYYNGTLVRARPAGNIALRAFDSAGLTGTRWNFTPGFHGNIGLGLSEFSGGTYTIEGWGSDIWGTSDEFHFVHRSLTGDGEIIARVNSVEQGVNDAHVWAKAGVMMRESLEPGARNVFMFRRPDGLATHQDRTTTDGSTSSTQQVNARWVRATRAGNTFTTSYSTTSASGPWTEAVSNTIAMPATIQIGLAMTSHLGIRRGTGVFSQVSVTEGDSPISNGSIGVFTNAIDIDEVWNRDNRISSFLLKKGYAVTMAEDPGGQGFSQYFAATEADLRIDLPAELNNKVSFMRIIPWRWVAKKGWAGNNDIFPTNIETHWKYEWEPTGSSRSNWEFLPMISGGGQDREFRWEEVRVRGGQTHFLGFNEPNVPNQGDLTVDEAIALWPKAQQLGLRLGSPAPTDNAAGLAWLAEFMQKADARGYRVDYICLHNYGQNNANGLRNWLNNVQDDYGLPVWLTEFQRDVDNSNPTAAQHETFLRDSVAMLEELDYLERYAYYNFNTETPSNSNASLFNGNMSVNSKGIFYRDLFSKPGYRNTGQPDWATAAISVPSGDLETGDDVTFTVTTSLDPASVDSVEFYANGELIGSDASAPFSVTTRALPPGQQAITAVIVTTFGERLPSNASQILFTDAAPSDLAVILSLDGAGLITWTSTPGETYRVESSPDLATPSWDLVEERVATSTLETITDPEWGTVPRKFYRVRTE